MFPYPVKFAEVSTLYGCNLSGSHDDTHKSPLVFRYLGFGRVDPVLL